MRFSRPLEVSDIVLLTVFLEILAACLSIEGVIAFVPEKRYGRHWPTLAPGVFHESIDTIDGGRVCFTVADDGPQEGVVAGIRGVGCLKLSNVLEDIEALTVLGAVYRS